MIEFEFFKELLKMGADGAAIGMAIILWRLERRLYNLELHTGLRTLRRKTDL